jgi:hypothetical protein
MRWRFGNFSLLHEASALTDNRDILWPDKSGTIALTSDLANVANYGANVSLVSTADISMTDNVEIDIRNFTNTTTIPSGWSIVSGALQVPAGTYLMMGQVYSDAGAETPITDGTGGIKILDTSDVQIGPRTEYTSVPVRAQFVISPLARLYTATETVRIVLTNKVVGDGSTNIAVYTNLTVFRLA